MSTKITKNTVNGQLNFELDHFKGQYYPDKPQSKYYTNSTTGLTFKLCERKEYTQLRPKYYLMQRNGDTWFYLTSLYPKGNDKNTSYTVEIKRKYFTLKLDTDKGSFEVI